ncbi:hypothetical protein MHB42_16875 [Lysinibacillus sp. FSL K6-0232]|uniref:hypothetical protein n=1 Tax=unclassified Lysinibacillus TaxID=2636778 RepID=UPI0030FAB081
MKEWWQRRKNKTRKSKKNASDSTFFDFVFDVLFWLPELIFLPFRIIFWLLRALGRSLCSIFDFF